MKPAPDGIAVRAGREDFAIAYEGPAGQTRLEPIHVPVEGGGMRTVRVYVSVNVTTDPELRDAATSGSLHKLDGIGELAIPFVYHDPRSARFALVVPVLMRHRELHERARLIEALAKDVEHVVPEYVREATTVIGAEGLRDYLGRPVGEAIRIRLDDLEARERQLLDAQEALSQREVRLKRRAEEVTRREDDLREQEEMLEATSRDISLREQELEVRFNELQRREIAVADARKPATQPPPPMTAPPAPAAPAVEEPVARPVEALAVTDEEVEELEEIDDLDPIRTNTGLAIAAPAAEPAPEEPDGFLAQVDDGEVEDVTDAPAEIRTDENVLVASPTQIATAVLGRDLGMEDLPNELMRRNLELGVEAADRIRVHVRVDENRRDAFGTNADLLVQLAIVDEVPIVLLALVDDTSGRPYVRRGALDPYDREAREILDRLGESFQADVFVFASDGKFERQLEIRADREPNVAMILERIERRPRPSSSDVAIAAERVLTAPPPARDLAHPYQATRERARNARIAADALARLTEWASPEKIEHALLVLSVPKPSVDGTMAAILEDAVRYGLALPVAMMSRAVSLGVGLEPGEIVSRQTTAFAETVGRADRGGLTIEETAANWEHLLDASHEHETAIDEKTYEAAWATIRKVRGDREHGAPAGDVDLKKLPEMGAPELVLLLDHPGARRQAALELVRRGDPALLETIMRSVRKMPRNEVVGVASGLVSFGEEAGDAFIDALEARKTFVRHAAALALGHLKLRRAVVPLVHRLQVEPSDVWKEIARVLGSFGKGAFRTLARGLKDPKEHGDRMAFALAHLALNGCEAQVEELTRDRDKALAMLALEGLRRRAEAADQLAKVAGERPIDPSDQLLEFAAAFQAELRKSPAASVSDVP
jgi:hypothetical protein